MRKKREVSLCRVTKARWEIEGNDETDYWSLELVKIAVSR